MFSRKQSFCDVIKVQWSSTCGPREILKLPGKCTFFQTLCTSTVQFICSSVHWVWHEDKFEQSVVLVQGVTDPETINNVALKVIESKSSAYLEQCHCIWISRLWARGTHWRSCLYFWKTSLSSLGKPAPLDSRQDSCLCGLRAQHAALRLWNLVNIPMPGN